MPALGAFLEAAALPRACLRREPPSCSPSELSLPAGASGWGGDVAGSARTRAHAERCHARGKVWAARRGSAGRAGERTHHRARSRRPLPSRSPRGSPWPCCRARFVRQARVRQVRRSDRHTGHFFERKEMASLTARPLTAGAPSRSRRAPFQTADPAQDGFVPDAMVELLHKVRARPRRRRVRALAGERSGRVAARALGFPRSAHAHPRPRSCARAPSPRLRSMRPRSSPT